MPFYGPEAPVRRRASSSEIAVRSRQTPLAAVRMNLVHPCRDCRSRPAIEALSPLALCFAVNVPGPIPLVSVFHIKGSDYQSTARLHLLRWWV